MEALEGYPFAREFAVRGPKAAEFLPARISDPEALLGERDAQATAPWTSDEVAELQDFNRSLDNPAGAELAAELQKPETLAVVTGQQPTLFASPMFVLYKALTARAWAGELQSRLGRTVIPVFWIASDDHDFGELKQCWLPSPGGMENIGRYVTRGPGVPKSSPAYLWRLAESRHRLITALERLLPDGGAKPQTIKLVTHLLADGPTFESSFGKMLSAFIEQQPMLYVAPRLNALRRRQVPVLRREFHNSDATNALLANVAERMLERGFEPMIRRNLAVLNAFYIKDGVRARLVRSGDGVRAEDPDSGKLVESFPGVDALVAELEQFPDRFSPNVVTRPIVQDSALPAICYVGGPGEITYFAQLREVYEQLGIFMSAIVLRAMAVLQGDAAAGLRNEEAEEMLERIDGFAERIQRDLKALRNGNVARHPHLHVAFDKTADTLQFAGERLRRRIERHFGIDQAVMNAPGAERRVSPLAYCGELLPGELGTRIARSIHLDAVSGH